MWSSADFATRWGCTIWLTCENVQGVKAFKFVNGYLFFFFLISKNVIYTNGYSMHEEHGANPENTRRKKQRKNKKRKPIHRLITILIKILWDEISEHISQNSDNEFE